MTGPRSEIDAHLPLLLRLSVWFDLVEAASVDADKAVAEVLHARQVFAPCSCQREILDAFDRHDRKYRERQLRDWRWRRP
jgi:hypothetical protein